MFLSRSCKWSAQPPTWQRDALRGVVQLREFSDTDVAQLAELCKSVHGLADAESATPLLTHHLPERAERGEAGRRAGPAPQGSEH